VAPRVEYELRAFARAHSENAAFIEKSLKFRCRVLEEFDRLVREGIPVGDLREADEPESDAVEEAFAVAQT